MEIGGGGEGAHIVGVRGRKFTVSISIESHDYRASDAPLCEGIGGELQ